MEFVDFYKQSVPLLADILAYSNKADQNNIVKYLSVVGLGNVLDTQPSTTWALAQKNGTFNLKFQDAAKQLAKSVADSKMKNKQQQMFKQNNYEQQPAVDLQPRERQHHEYQQGQGYDVLEDPLELLNQPSPTQNFRKSENNFQNMNQPHDSQQPFDGGFGNNYSQNQYNSPGQGVSEAVKTSYENQEIQSEIKYLKEKLDSLNRQIDIETMKKNKVNEDQYYGVQDENYQSHPHHEQKQKYHSRVSKNKYRSPQSRKDVTDKITQSPPPDLYSCLKSRSPQKKGFHPHLDDKQVKQLMHQDQRQNAGTSKLKSSSNKIGSHQKSKKAYIGANQGTQNKFTSNPRVYRSPSQQSNKDLLIEKKLFSSDTFNFMQQQRQNNFNNQSQGQQYLPQNSYNQQQQYANSLHIVNNENVNRQNQNKHGTAVLQVKKKVTSPQQQTPQQQLPSSNVHQKQKEYYQSVLHRKQEEEKQHVLPRTLRHVESKIKDQVQKDRELYKHRHDDGGNFDDFEQNQGDQQNYQDQEGYMKYQNSENGDQQFDFDQNQYQSLKQQQNMQAPFTSDPYQHSQQQQQMQNPYAQQQLQQQPLHYSSNSGQYVTTYEFDPNQNAGMKHRGSTETYPNEYVQYLSVDSRQTQGNENNEYPQQQQQQSQQQNKKRYQMSNSPSNQVSPNNNQDVVMQNQPQHFYQNSQQMNPNSSSLQQSQQQQQSFQYQPQHSFNNNNLVDSQIYQSFEQNQRSRQYNQSNPFNQGQIQYAHSPQQSGGPQQNFGTYPQSQYNTYNSSQQQGNFRQSQNPQQFPQQQQQQNYVDYANSFLSSPLMKHLNSDQNLFTSAAMPGNTNINNPYLNTSNTIFTSQNKQSKVFIDQSSNLPQNSMVGNQFMMMSPQANNFSPPQYDQKQSQIIGSNSIYIQNQAQTNPSHQMNMNNYPQMNNNSQNTDNNSSQNNILQSNNDNLAVSWVKGSSSGHSNTPQNPSNIYTNQSNKPFTNTQKGGSTSSNPLIGSQLTVSKNIESQSPGKGIEDDEIQNIASPQFLNNNPNGKNVNTFGDQDDHGLVGENINSYRLEDDQPKYFISEKNDSLKYKESVCQIPTRDIPSRKGSSSSKPSEQTPQNPQQYGYNQGYQQKYSMNQQQEIKQNEDVSDKKSQNGYLRQSDQQTANFREKVDNEDEDEGNHNKNYKNKESLKNNGISSSSDDDEKNDDVHDLQDQEVSSNSEENHEENSDDHSDKEGMEDSENEQEDSNQEDHNDEDDEDQEEEDEEDEEDEDELEDGEEEEYQNYESQFEDEKKKFEVERLQF